MLKLAIHRHFAASLTKLLLLSICLISPSASICADSSDLLTGEIKLRDLQQPAFASWFEKNYVLTEYLRFSPSLKRVFRPQGP